MSREELRHYWRLKFEEFTTTDQSASRFCRERNLKYAQFLRWRQKFKAMAADSESTPIFEELNSSPRLVLNSRGLELEVDSSINFNSLVQVIGALCRAAELQR